MRICRVRPRPCFWSFWKFGRWPHHTARQVHTPHHPLDASVTCRCLLLAAARRRQRPRTHTPRSLLSLSLASHSLLCLLHSHTTQQPVHGRQSHRHKQPPPAHAHIVPLPAYCGATTPQQHAAPPRAHIVPPARVKRNRPSAPCPAEHTRLYQLIRATAH